MKRFALVGLSIAALSITGNLPAIASAPLVDTLPHPMTLNFNAPFISSSGLQGDHHLIRVMVLGMSLEDLMITVPPQMSEFRSITVSDEFGKPISTKVEKAGNKVTLVFNQPVTPGHTIEVDFSDANVPVEEGQILLYGVTAKETGISREIPIGTARIQVPSRN